MKHLLDFLQPAGFSGFLVIDVYTPIGEPEIDAGTTGDFIFLSHASFLNQRLRNQCFTNAGNVYRF